MSHNEYDVNLRYGVDSQMSLVGKTAVITGGLGGIAMATNHMLLEKGAQLVLMYPEFEQHRLAEARQQLGDAQVAYQSCDVTDPTSVHSAFSAAQLRFGQIDILVNCAGYVNLQPATEITLAEWQQHIAVNLTGPFLCAQEMARRAIAGGHGGKIVNIASQAASIAIDHHCAYTSAKAGLLGMTKVMAKEWAPFGITVNTLSPTVVLTPMGEKAWRGEKGEAMKKLIPLGRFAYTDEIAAAILFFASNGSDMITGADLMIDGGFTIW
ncbi:GolD/DthD family dehydrogenase [Serratia odorifera]|jgi:NAD(P)-dependent dehydrogenase (short-subunit alcohol dehydrogenase family)|uniref:Oxidoreductase, short chain dehydrogenase/reductase family protein n=2 Tax=Serratia odorifera TaxID=618 RepID=D4E5W9_SEROD|nr:D-threitol dehydrogenase [Serratia odorifera]EFE94698.1 oxidoreductase, short chain dehydrogenase/reductase family protein [Serratia odorifera DSM 4582]PNK89591.1 D-threitol dehydrogenase [Serratia odorifera]RII70824.1 D-threitol dehydrogenase [Serratia odorifera]VDZ62811.1 3-oxoacyl-[acyl-carrier-protein] reductase FabG [Serratia odorifera]HEJ9093828.1 D-threitol dehydrogenase [Serratia odorifera]